MIEQQTKTIQAIDKASVAKICSGQVILDLATAVKELIENALDAGATSVEVRLKEHGLQLIEVADNGKGVHPKDYEALALKYHTSKLAQFNDLNNLHTFGFRGEALSSLAALSELSVITRTADQDAATRLEFDKHGKLISTTPCARGIGTTVAIKDLFATLPVRKQELSRNVRREIAKLRLLLQQYAVLAGQAQLFASDQAGKGARVVLVSTSNAGSGVRDRVSAVLGAKVAAVLQPIEFELATEGVKVTGLVSRAGCGVKGEKLRQFCCVNGRPVELPRAVKTLNETYKSLYSSLVGLKPMAFLCFELPAGTFDVNVTPDKRTVFIQKEVAIMAALQQALQALWEPSRYSYTVNSSGELFDSQRAVPPAPLAAATTDDDDDDDDTAAAAAAAEGTTAADAGVMDEKQQQDDKQGQQQQADAAAAAPAPRPPSLASFMIGSSSSIGTQATPQAVAAAAAGGISTCEAGNTAQAAVLSEAAAAAATAEGVGGYRAAAKRQHEDGDIQRSNKSARVSVSSAGCADVADDADVAVDADVAATAVHDDVTTATHGVRAAQRRWQQQQLSDNDSEPSSDEEQPPQQQQRTDTSSISGRNQVSAAQRRQQQQQPGGVFSLASYAMNSTGALNQAAGPQPVSDRSSSRRATAVAAASAVGSKQPSLAAFGFQVSTTAAAGQQRQQVQQDSDSDEQLQQQQQEQEQQQQEQQSHVEEIEIEQNKDGTEAVLMQAAAAAGASGGMLAGAAATAATAAAEDERLNLDDTDDDVVLLNDATEQQQPQQQHVWQSPPPQQQQQQPSQPAVLQYSIQQLMADVQLRMQQEQQQQRRQQGQHSRCHLSAASLQGELSPEASTAAAATGANDAATVELERCFDKSEFSVMQPLGQFNLGFIIARLRQDLYIIDQHAADEKSTFERLMGSYAVNKQPLLQPRRLTTLSAMDQQVIRDNMEVFRRNGFDFVDQQLAQSQQQQQQTNHTASSDSAPQQQSVTHSDQRLQRQLSTPTAQVESMLLLHTDGWSNADDTDQGSASELLLSAVPLVKGSGTNGALGEEVLTELLDLMASGECRPEDLRPKRVRDMLASRACRSSIMIGSPLTRQQQARIVKRLAELDAPWNCPHGRPTMRHLAVLPDAQSED